jgi:hypothetical protein
LRGEWHRRGACGSEQFRALTSELFRSAFGMDVQQYREYKGLARCSRSRAKLRDHLSDLELALVALAETTAMELSRRRGSSTCEQLLVDVVLGLVLEVGDVAAPERDLDMARILIEEHVEALAVGLELVERRSVSKFMVAEFVPAVIHAPNERSQREQFAELSG